MGSVMAPSTAVLPKKRKRHSRTAASVPRTSEMTVATSAIVNELAKASIRSALLKSFW